MAAFYEPTADVGLSLAEVTSNSKRGYYLESVSSLHPYRKRKEAEKKAEGGSESETGAIMSSVSPEYLYSLLLFSPRVKKHDTLNGANSTVRVRT